MKKSTRHPTTEHVDMGRAHGASEKRVVGRQRKQQRDVAVGSCDGANARRSLWSNNVRHMKQAMIFPMTECVQMLVNQPCLSYHQKI